MRSPRFSIVIPSYNRHEYVGLAIDSVLSQTFTDFEIVFLDDGSKDGAIEVLKSYGSRIKLICQGNRGAEAARSRGVAAARGEYVVLLDDDDMLFLTALATYDRLIQALHEPPVILGAVRLIYDRAALPSSEDGPIEYLEFPDYLSRDVPVSLICSQLVVKRSVALATGAFRVEPTAFPFDIPDMMLRLGTSGPFIILRRPNTVAYRQHSSNFVKAVDSMINSSSCLARLELRGEYPGGAGRRFERYACIGTMALFWVCRALKRRYYRTALGLLLDSAPMILAGLIRRSSRCLRVRVPLRRLQQAPSEHTTGRVHNDEITTSL
jgi:glycosyltransferase involved in cell wall biosynthesis